MAPTETEENLQTELKRLSGLVNDLTALLRSQRDLLRQRGINLPPGALNGLRATGEGLQAMAQEITGSDDELDQLRELAKTAAMVNSTLELDEVLNTVMDTVIQLTGAERGYLVLRDEDTCEMMFRVARGMDTQTLDQSDFMVSKTIVERVAETGEPVVTTNAQEDDRFKSQESVVGYSLRSILCVPLKARGEIIGVAYADNRIREGVFGPGELNLLTQFANQAAIAIYNARLYENVQRALADKTALKELLDNVFASIVSGVITTDAADTVTTCNRAARAILDVDDGDLCPGTVLTQVLPLDEDFSEVLQVVRTQGTRPTMEVEPTISTRGPVTLNLRLSPFQDADEATQGVAIVMDDLTELRRQEAQLAAVRRYLPPAMVDNIQDIEALALSGVRREVTVAFIDVIPFEVLVSASDTEGFMAALNRYLTVATDAINAHEGIVDKYAGNHIMSLFNTQLNPTNDHPWRAVQAALSIKRGLSRLQSELGQADTRHYCRVGIHTGPVTVGNVGSLERREFTAIGASINLAKRLEQTAEMGQIILSEDTYTRVKPDLDARSGNLEVIDRGKKKVKGFQQLIQAYEVRYR